MMKTIWLVLCGVFVLTNASGQNHDAPPQTKIMTLGVFHFAYPNLDAVKTADEDKISVLEEPYQSEIIAISRAIAEFKPGIIAVESMPDQQGRIDSLYALYSSDQFNLGKNEIYQLGFRIGKASYVPVIYCVDDWGRPYPEIEELFNDSIRLAQFEDYYLHPPDSIYTVPVKTGKVSSIIDELIYLNQPERLKQRLSVYLQHPFRYEEVPGDFTGVDFETGRWFNRNLRIFRNIQRIPRHAEDRILLIIGAEHLNVLNLFFDASQEFELVSPLPYLERANESK